MTALIRFSLSTICTVVFSLLACSSLAQDYKVGSPQAYALSVELRSGDTDRIAQALEHFPDYFDVYDNFEILSGMDPVVEDGLVSALDSQLDYFESEVTDEMKEYFYDGVIKPLVLYTARIKDRKAIPVLLRASERSNVASLALARFGPDMVPVILDYMDSPERTAYQIQRAFEPLAFIANIWRPLDEETHAMLKQLAIDCMQGYLSACISPDTHQKYVGSRLASRLGDADLKQMVIDIADEITGFAEIHLAHWYEGPSEADQEDPIDEND